MAVEERTLSKELFSGDDQVKLKELLEISARTRLHPAISNFLQQIEGILETAKTNGEILPETTNKEAVAAIETEAAKSAPQQIPQEPRALGMKRVREFFYSHPDTDIQAVIEYTGATERAVKSNITRMRSLGQLEFDRLRLTETGRNMVEDEHTIGDIQSKTVPVVQITATQPTLIPWPAAKLPDDMAFSRILESAIETLPPQTQEIIRRHALNVLGERLSGGTPYDHQRLRKFEDLASVVESVVAKGGGSEDVLKILQGFGLQANHVRELVGDRTPARPAAQQPVSRPAQPTTPARQHGIRTYAQPRPPEPVNTQIVADYISKLVIAAQDLGSREQDAVRSYVLKLVDADAGTQPQDLKVNQSQLRALSVFTEAFARIQRFEDLPHELYDVLDGFNQQDDRDIREFGDELHTAKDSFDVLVAVSKRTRSRYSNPVGSIEDVYREDAFIAKLLRKREGFHSETVAARKSIPSLRAANFYETIKKIPGDINWGGRYNDLLKFVRTDARKAVKFMEWASSQNNVESAQFDREMAKYIRLGGRAQPVSKEDLNPYGR